MVQCAIKFEQNPHGTFYSGSVVNGKVEISISTFEKPMNVRGIYFIISGNANVHWTESRSSKDRSSESYTAKDTYIHTTTYLHGSPEGNTITINPGGHIYNFSCSLPHQLPPSVEGHNGHIRYTAKVVFDRPWKFDKTFTVGFTVLKISDLNCEDPAIRLPTTLQVNKRFCCWPCQSKPMILEATTPQAGYVSGQNIPLTVNLFNESGIEVQHVGVSLKQIMRCTSDSPSTKSRLEEVTISKMIIGSIQNLPKEEMHIDLLVPPIPPTCSQAICRIIQVNYELRIKAFINGPHISPVVVIPIVIGNIPLTTYQPYQATSIPSATNAISSNPNSPEICAADSGLPPPTYEEALYMERINVNNEDKHPISESNYLPRYPVFNFEPTAPTSTTLKTICEKSDE